MPTRTFVNVVVVVLLLFWIQTGFQVSTFWAGSLIPLPSRSTRRRISIAYDARAFFSILATLTLWLISDDMKICIFFFAQLLALSQGEKGDLGTATRSVNQAVERTRINLNWMKRHSQPVTALVKSWTSNGTFVPPSAWLLCHPLRWHSVTIYAGNLINI